MSWMGPTVREVRSAPHLHARHPARPPPPSAAEVPPRALPEPVPTACAPQVSCAARPVRRRAAAEHDHDVKPPSSTTSATRGWLARRGRPSAGLRGPAAAPWACTGEALRPAALARHAACLVRARCRSRDAQARACEVWVWGSRSSGRAASPGARRWRRRGVAHAMPARRRQRGGGAAAARLQTASRGGCVVRAETDAGWGEAGRSSRSREPRCGARRSGPSRGGANRRGAGRGWVEIKGQGGARQVWRGGWARGGVPCTK